MNSYPGNVHLPRPLQRWFHLRFTGMLASLILLLMIAPFVLSIASRTGRPFGSLLLGIAFVQVYLSAVYTVSNERRQLKLATGLSLITIVAMATAFITEAFLAWEIASIVSTILLAYVICLTLRFLFSVDRVTMDTIAAAICVYLLMGLLWAFLYSLTSQINPLAFSETEEMTRLANAAGDDAPAATVRFAGLDTGTGLYFSFVTLTTLGYGDITPLSTPARMLTAAEAIAGQIYLAVLVARLVGLHISQQKGMSDET
ncbi:voltage-gated potassium channel [Maioricimonas rarisocia]|uniref:Voltage-gated potassium channel n=1 Tax=Maioricimonas rarisocia TaxID=2528026 RepID=A0A517Z1G7_9PLAN|nr:potassium channel family protein [Maioricimonas rarisocia]QDU36330.1 voltage-gated potassium channel [Maioricimonas rarisocia]